MGTKVKSISEIQDATFTYEIYSTLNPLTNREWTKLFPSLPDSPEMINLIQSSGFDGFNLYSIVVRKESIPILILPLFETTYDISELADESFRKIFNSLANWIPKLFKPKVLGVGFVEGEWGQIGFDSNIDMETLNLAWDMALKVLDSFSLDLGADIISFVGFNEEGSRIIPMNKLKKYMVIPSTPCAQVPIVFGSIEDYIISLSSSMRKDIRKKMRESSDIKIIRTKNIKPHLETIYQFYLKLVERSSLVFGVHRLPFFEQVCELVSGAEYVLYFTDEKLIGFKLVVVKSDCMIDKYFGMDSVLGRKYNLYFISWIENIRYCIENKIPLYHAGPSEEDIKVRLGAKFLPSFIFFKHRNQFIQFILNVLKDRFAYEPNVDLPPVKLGSYWEDFVQR